MKTEISYGAAVLSVLVIVSAVPAFAQQEDAIAELREELRTLQAEYEARLSELEARLFLFFGQSATSA